jgi:hypothetical protein
MKKTALTFGLFSLAMVATSFDAPQNTNYLATSDTIFSQPSIPTDGNATGGVVKKHDFHQTNVLSLNSNRNSNFSTVNQVIGTDKKVD